MTRVFRTELVLPVAPVGQENPLPPLRPLTAAQQVTNVDELPPDLADGVRYGKLDSVLPCLVQDCYGRERTEQALPALVLENAKLRATVLPSLGGRLYSLARHAWHYGYGGRLDRIPMPPEVDPNSFGARPRAAAAGRNGFRPDPSTATWRYRPVWRVRSWNTCACPVGSLGSGCTPAPAGARSNSGVLRGHCRARRSRTARWGSGSGRGSTCSTAGWPRRTRAVRWTARW
ncbi:hypothetical protein ACPZ19_17410 [Amycolatopsis lurida]